MTSNSIRGKLSNSESQNKNKSKDHNQPKHQIITPPKLIRDRGTRNFSPQKRERKKKELNRTLFFPPPPPPLLPSQVVVAAQIQTNSEKEKQNMTPRQMDTLQLLFPSPPRQFSFAFDVHGPRPGQEVLKKCEKKLRMGSIPKWMYDRFKSTL